MVFSSLYSFFLENVSKSNNRKLFRSRLRDRFSKRLLDRLSCLESFVLSDRRRSVYRRNDDHRCRSVYRRHDSRYQSRFCRRSVLAGFILLFFFSHGGSVSPRAKRVLLFLHLSLLHSRSPLLAASLLVLPGLLGAFLYL